MPFFLHLRSDFPFHTLPLEIYGMTTNVTTPVLYALGTVTTGVSFAVIALALAFVSLTQVPRKRT